MMATWNTEQGSGHKGASRVIRGGSWNNSARNLRAAYRNANHPGNRNDNLGFRLARAQTWVGWPVSDPIWILPVLCISGYMAKTKGGKCGIGGGVLVGGADARRALTVASCRDLGPGGPRA